MIDFLFSLQFYDLIDFILTSATSTTTVCYVYDIIDFILNTINTTTTTTNVFFIFMTLLILFFSTTTTTVGIDSDIPNQ